MPTPPFSRTWFDEQLKSVINSAGPRYTPAANVTLPITRFFSWLGRDAAFKREWAEHHKAIEADAVDSYVFDRLIKLGILDKTAKSRIQVELRAVSAGALRTEQSLLRPIPYRLLSERASRALDLLDPTEKKLDELVAKSREAVKAPPPATEAPALDATGNQEKPDLDGLTYQLRKVQGILRETIELSDETQGTITGQDSVATLSNSPRVLLVGEAGIGKTHLLCDLAAGRLREGRPTVVVLAHQLVGMTDPLQSVIRRLRLSMTNEEFLRTLNALAHKRGKRALVIVDAINEGDREVWRSSIASLLEQFQKYPGVGLVLSCRSPFHMTMMPQGTPIGLLRHQGYREREVEAVRIYFNRYGLPLPEVPLLSGEFSNPLFLKIFCESIENAVLKKKHDRIRDIASGQEGMLNVFEDFVIRRSRDVAKQFSLNPLNVWKLLKEGIAAAMAARGRTHLTLEEAHEIFRTYGLVAGREKAFLKELSNAGLLFEDVVFDAQTRVGAEVVRLPYQKFSDHLIARYLLRAVDKTNPAGALAPGTPLARLLAPVSGLHRYDSIVEALLIEFPERAGNRELLEFIPDLNTELARLFLNGLPWRKSSSFGKSTSQYIRRILGHEPLVNEALSTLLALSTKPKHPFGIAPLDRYLRGMKMPARDLHWSEFLRRQYDESVSQRLLGWLETTDQEKLTREYAEVYIRTLRWFLCTTNRLMRDRATRGLYTVGRKYPELLFNATLDSLSINDPYIPERMLAASYGVIMALHAIPDMASFRSGPLKDYARQLFSRMFKKGGKYATTHILMRDYSRHSIELALLHHPSLLSASEKLTIRPPFKHGGIRKWGRAPDIEKGRGSPGSPIHGDFLNYTLGTLVKNRDNYDFKHAGYVRVVENVHWRLNQLGYALKDFEAIDREIASRYWREEGGNKIDRYGKKYGWIAFFELAGYRMDTGSSRREARTQRTPEVDIEPSFPIQLPSARVLRTNFVGRRKGGVSAWIRSGAKPNFRPYLRRHRVGDHAGPWLALDAFVEHRDTVRHRSVLLFLRTLLVKKADKARIVELLPRSEDFGHSANRLEDTQYTFAGEIPWSDTYPNLANEAKLRLWTGESVTERIPGPGASIGDRFTFARTASPRDRKRGYMDVQRKVYEEFEAEAAARTYSWESHHTSITDGLSVPVLTREISSAFQLSSRAQSFDLFDPSGRRVSVCVESTRPDGSRERLLYCRQSIIEKYLKSKGLELVWVVWGERRFLDPNPIRETKRKGPYYQQYSSIHTRDDLR